MAEDGKKTYSAKQVASRIGTDAKQLRKFLRDKDSGYTAVGQGGRYDFPEEDVPVIKKAFDTWNSTRTRRNRQPSPQVKLATTAGLIPGQRKDSPTPRPRVDKDNKQGLHRNALDGDTLQERFAGIGARMQRHGLTMKQGRFVPQLPLNKIPGLVESLPEDHPAKQTEGLITTPEPQTLDFSEVEDDI
jgi:hypothetical protein